MSDVHLDYERERNREYFQAIARTTTVRIKGVDSRRLASEWGPLLGRVSLSPSERDEPEFYVGPRPAKLPDGTRVVSWVAPAASLLFSGARTWKDQQVRVKRRFRTDATGIRAYADQWLVAQEGDAFPRRRREIARPPARPPEAGVGATRQDRNRLKIEEEIAANTAKAKQDALDFLRRSRVGGSGLTANLHQKPAETPQVDPHRRVARPSGPPDMTSSVVPKPESTDELPDPLRSAAREAMSEPRRRELPSVLATMSSEQYQAVTTDPAGSVVFTGHPGTGKTIVATHRLAWLTHPDRDNSSDYVLLVGPTDAWADSLRHSIAELTDSSRVQVHSVPGLMRFFLETPTYGKHRPEQHEDTSQELVDALAAFDAVQASPSLSEAYAALQLLDLETSSPSIRNWLKSLPPTIEQAVETVQLRPMLTYLNIRRERFTKFSHIIVDEAQDLRPLEWAILRLLNGGSWTILGDLNQRRTLFSDSSWETIAERLGTELPVVDLRHGYRSTDAIMGYAAALLDRGVERRDSSVLGAGEPPRVLDARAEGRAAEAVALSEVTRIHRVLGSEATVAVITTDVKTSQRTAERSGWTRAGFHAGVPRWDKGDGLATLHLLTPQLARGLEFDAVVVVEPALFTPANPGIKVTGQYRTLYTSLTRANKLLSIIHERPLPAPLRHRKP